MDSREFIALWPFGVIRSSILRRGSPTEEGVFGQKTNLRTANSGLS